jgi:hypothetical protein
VLPSPLTALVVGQTPPAMQQQCTAVNAWSVVVVGVVTPLLVMYRHVGRSRIRFAQQQQRQHEWLLQLRQHRQQREQQREASAAAAAEPALVGAQLLPKPVLPFAGHWLFDLYLLSSLVWSVASTAP